MCLGVDNFTSLATMPKTQYVIFILTNIIPNGQQPDVLSRFLGYAHSGEKY